jgi:hypothetical protein
MPYEFDHIVIIARDKITLIAERMKNLGFQLTPLAKHNLGSCNQLAMLSTAYIEVLGWEEGTTPQRKEIADLAIGLDALVFRTSNAFECFDNLQSLGFSPNPVQDLSRPAQVDGKEELAKFKTVRFSSQPIPGLRIYFCEHLTPDYLWFDDVLEHPNLSNHLREIMIETPQLVNTSNSLMQLLGLSEVNILKSNDEYAFMLPNCTLVIREDTSLPLTKITSVKINHQLENGLIDTRVNEITLSHQLCEVIQ